MRLLKRNCTEATYYPATWTEIDDNGLHTGEHQVVFGEPVELKRVNLSIPNGHASQEWFGKDTRYTHVMLIDRAETEITEHGEIECGGIRFEITAVRQSQNVLSIALRRKTKNNASV